MDETIKNPKFEALQAKMRQHGAQDRYYVISEISGFDGVSAGLQEVVEKLSLNGYASIAIGLPSGFTHFRAESLGSCQPNFFLKPKQRFDGVRWN